MREEKYESEEYGQEELFYDFNSSSAALLFQARDEEHLNFLVDLLRSTMEKTGVGDWKIVARDFYVDQKLN